MTDLSRGANLPYQCRVLNAELKQIQTLEFSCMGDEAAIELASQMMRGRKDSVAPAGFELLQAGRRVLYKLT